MSFIVNNSQTSMSTISTVLVLLLILLFPSLTFSSLPTEDDINARATAPEPSNCVTYDRSQRTITITCKANHLTDIYNQLRDLNILDRQSRGV
jgi:hypothetical protein